MKTTFNNRRTGLTLVELLVVIAIMSLLTALIVPQVRLINKDRNIREAGRVVGTTLTQARDRAIATGAAGLMIERNLNLNVGESVFYGGTRLYLMRKLPNFQGEDAVVGTSSVPGSPVEFTVTMDKPYKWDQQSPEERVIQVGDRMRLNHGSIRYPITGFSDPGVPTKIKLRVGGISGPLEA
ncbi:MAG: prepilin-type N-terminal cleavage/methylation domain-containing protein, partial [Mariniblastus sp.]|nr:prepilin-type N-terminal cleavage/methylation domain-containing protein [Mariniblastus sp.]